MSEPFSKHRALPASVDLRGRDGVGAESGRGDPLAELARLVGREDPFRDLFPARDGKPVPRRVDRSTGMEPTIPTPETLDPVPDPFRQSSMRLPREPDLYAEDEATSSAAEEDRAFHAPLGQDRRDSFRLPALPSSDEYFGAVDPENPVKGGEAPPLNADLWAQGLPEPISADPLQFAPAEEEAPAGHSTRRTLVVLAAVLALTAGGLGATFLVRGGGSSAASGEPPTILADAGPTKIQPPDTSNQATGGDGNTALIEKSASDNVSNAKVVDTQEQPVDLNQLPKAPPATAQPDDGRVAVATVPAGTNATAFPQPRKVKTILIRPDGSVIGESSAANPPQADNGAVAPTAPAPATTAARPATPKATARATSTPKSAATPSEGVAAVKPKVAHAAPKAKPAPVQVADAGADATASTVPTPSPGSFAVQLAAPASEQEAKDVSARLQKKFASQLDGHSTGIFKAEKGDKSVYRVRVSNMSQDDAKGLCSKLQAGGGSCFVVRN